MFADGITAPPAVYEIGGRRFVIGAIGLADAVADAHASHRRPRCMCKESGVEMYVARLGGGYIVKRMPGTGSQHALDCPSYEPPAECSGLGQLLGDAIREDPATGETTLRLNFPLTKMPGRSAAPPAAGSKPSLSSSGARLSLRGLLHFLWDQAELTRWHAGFAGKRNWATVRRHLLNAAAHKLTRGEALLSRLYVPEPFSIDVREAINARRLAQWQQAVATPGTPQQLMLLIGEVKEIVPAHLGFRVIVKHMPDWPITIDESLYRQLGRRFDHELALWCATDDIHMVMIATFGLSGVGVPILHELSLMPVTWQWLPVENGFDKQLLDRLVSDRRSFMKCLHYNLARSQSIASVVLADCSEPAPLLYIESQGKSASDGSDKSNTIPEGVWCWHPLQGAMPPFPRQSRTRPAEAEHSQSEAVRVS